MNGWSDAPIYRKIVGVIKLIVMMIFIITVATPTISVRTIIQGQTITTDHVEDHGKIQQSPSQEQTIGVWEVD